MARLIARRLGFALLVLFCVELAVFLITHALGNPARLMLPFTATEEQVAQFSHAQGFDRPLVTQFVDLISGAVRGDFGDSYWQQMPAGQLVFERLPATASLIALAMLLALVTAIPLGVWAATRQGTAADNVAVTTSLLGVSMPAFWIGELLIILFAVKFRIFPASGIGGASSYVLPVVTLAALPFGRLTQIVRSAVLDQLNQQYVVVGRAMGLSERSLVYKHALKNAAVPIITMAGWELGRLIAGFTVVVEVVFNWPGVGLLVLQAIQHHDIPLIMADVSIVATLVVLLNFLLDVLYGILDPRVRGSGKSTRSKKRIDESDDNAQQPAQLPAPTGASS